MIEWIFYLVFLVCLGCLCFFAGYTHGHRDGYLDAIYEPKPAVPEPITEQDEIDIRVDTLRQMILDECVVYESGDMKLCKEHMAVSEIQAYADEIESSGEVG